MSNNWITDRPPTEEDAGPAGLVWTTYNGEVVPWSYDGVAKGTPWMPITPPEPYVKPKRWRVSRFGDAFTAYDSVRRVHATPFIPTREAAERIAAIYEEVMP